VPWLVRSIALQNVTNDQCGLILKQVKERLRLVVGRHFPRLLVTRVKSNSVKSALPLKSVRKIDSGMITDYFLFLQ